MFHLFPRSALLGLACALSAVPTLAQQPAAPTAPTVIVAPAEMKALDKQQDFLGRVQAQEKVDLRARVSGYLTEVKFSEGSMVKKALMAAWLLYFEVAQYGQGSKWFRS